MTVHLAIISHLRPHAVPAMQAHLGALEATWYVGAGEARAYRQAGAERVVESGALCAARNRALDEGAAAGAVTVQLSDDLRRLGWATGRTAAEVDPLTLPQALAKLTAALDASGAHLAGAAPTANPYFSRPRLHSHAFIVGDLIAVRTPACGLRFDPGFRLKEDYDYTCQHLAHYGRVARVDQLLATFAHRTNPGGAVAVRTAELEAHMIARLQSRWPGVFRLNPKRAGEVLMRWPASKGEDA